MKILITGSSGFIGSALVKKLIEIKNIELLLISRKSINKHSKNVTFLRGDLNKLSFLKKKILNFNPKIFVHLAWEGIPDFSEMISKKNYTNSINLVNFIVSETNVQKIIISGSCFEKKKSGKYKLPFSIYKNKLNRKIRELCKIKKIAFIWLRFFYVYGVNQKSSSLFPFIFKSLKIQNTIHIQNPNYKNDFIYLDDVIGAIIKSIYLKKYVNSDLDIGSGKSIKINNIVKQIGIYLKKKIKIESNSKHTNLNYYANLKKTVKILNWKPKININQGIKKISKFY